MLNKQCSSIQVCPAHFLQVFHDVAYKARNREDLLAGIDEFLDKVTVLPPGEWDPTIRLEPPPKVPSQVGRNQERSPVKCAVFSLGNESAIWSNVCSSIYMCSVVQNVSLLSCPWCLLSESLMPLTQVPIDPFNLISISSEG